MISKSYFEWVINSSLHYESFPTWYAHQGVTNAIDEIQGAEMKRRFQNARTFLETKEAAALTAAREVLESPVVKVEPFTMLQKQVELFMRAAGKEILESPTIPDSAVTDQKIDHLEEELEELVNAIDEEHLPQIGDGAIDLIYVALGLLSACGIKGQDLWDEVQRSNMTKFIDGHRDPGGKWIKGPSYSPANIEQLINEQREKADKAAGRGVN